MAGRLDDGARFWLDYVETMGGLWEGGGETALAVLPATLVDEHGGADQLVVTSDPDVAREDAATLLAAGHPFLLQAAQAVLGEGDCGVVRLPGPPPAKVPSTDQLLESARDQFPVDHGRIDLTGGAAPGVRQVLRLGALATYDLSDDNHFQEQAECWVDVPSRLAVPDPVVSHLAHDVRRADDHRAASLPEMAELTAALAHADDLIRARARVRESELSAQVSDAAERETERAVNYYAEAVRSLQRRLDTAPPERVDALATRISGTEAERDRRLAEIAEKYQARTTLRPFRLHVLAVPVMRLPVDVRRGDRRYPLVLDWMSAARTFAGIRCPHCAGTAPLVAAKTRLGCEECLAKPTAQPPMSPPPSKAPAPTLAAPASPAPASPAPASPAPASPAPASPAPASPAPSRAPALSRAPAADRRPDRPAAKAAKAAHRPASPPRKIKAPALSPQVIDQTGQKLVNSLWEKVAAGDRRVQRLYAPDTPAAAMHQMFGPAGPLRVLGVGITELPQAVYVVRSGSVAGHDNRHLVVGSLECSELTYRFQLCWRFAGRTPQIEEIQPFQHAAWPRMFTLLDRFAGASAGLLHSTEPAPRIELDPVLRALWHRGVPVHGMPLVLRGIAAWWRLPDRDDLLEVHARSVLAAAVDRMVAYRAGSPEGSKYDHAATTYRVDGQAVRAVTPVLQRRLGMSAIQPW